MTSVSIARSEIDRLKSGYTRLANDLGMRMRSVQKQATAERAPVDAALKTLVRKHVTRLDGDDLALFSGPSTSKSDAFDVPAIAARMAADQATYRAAYAPVAIYDKGRSDYEVTSARRHARSELQMNQARIDQLKGPLTHITNSNRILARMGAPEITPETAGDYAHGNTMRWLRDKSFRIARMGVRNYERAAKAKGVQDSLRESLESFEASNSAVMVQMAEIKNLSNEQDAISKRSLIKSDAELLKSLQERILGRGHDVDYIDALARGPLGDALPQDAVERSIKAKAFDSISSSIGQGKTAADVAARRLEEQGRKLIGKRGRVRNFDSWRMQSDFRQFEERVLGRSREGLEVAEKVSAYRFDTIPDDKQTRQQSPATANMMFLTMAAAVLVSLENGPSAIAAGQLGVSRDDLNSSNIGIDTRSLGLDYGIGSQSVAVDDVRVDTQSTDHSSGIGFGFGAFD